LLKNILWKEVTLHNTNKYVDHPQQLVS